MPKKDAKGKQYVNWSKTALPWMSIGYETQVPPISTLTFYNAIANNGKMMRPRFVKQVMKDGEVIMEFPPEVIKEQIAKPKTVATIQTILEHVVSQGLGRKAGSKSFKVAGKTGTAQIWTASGKTTSFLLSFAGFFPADAPRYSCIVCIQKSGLPASGGGMSGVVFHHISEGIMAQSLRLDAKDAKSASSVLVPEVKGGNVLAADYVLNHFGFKVKNGWGGAHAFGNPVWGTVSPNGKSLVISKSNSNTASRHSVPDVHNMGARDAVYMLEERGIKAVIVGRGKVHEQSIAPGTEVKKGMVCTLKLI